MEDEKEVVVPETTEEVVVEEGEETIEDLRAKHAASEEARKKAEEIAENQRIRAEKAERKAKENKQEDQSLTVKDTLAMVNAKVSEEDFDEVVRVAKVLGKSVSEALQDKTLQTILRERAEERSTAAATQVGKSQRGVSKTTGESLLERAQTTGEVPETTEDMQKLFLARLARKAKR